MKIIELTYADFDGLTVKECLQLFMQFNAEDKLRWEIGDGKFTNDRLLVEPQPNATYHKMFISNKEDE